MNANNPTTIDTAHISKQRRFVSRDIKEPHADIHTNELTDNISKAISIGGDSDTIAAIAGSLAETMYQIPTDLYQKAIYKLDDFLVCSIEASIKFRSEYLQR